MGKVGFSREHIFKFNNITALEMAKKVTDNKELQVCVCVCVGCVCWLYEVDCLKRLVCKCMSVLQHVIFSACSSCVFVCVCAERVGCAVW